jgi:hypothetical protein
MDSLPTGLIQSWLIVATLGVSPILVLFLADTIGRVLRQAKGRGGVDSSGEGESRIAQ